MVMTESDAFKKEPVAPKKAPRAKRAAPVSNSLRHVVDVNIEDLPNYLDPRQRGEAPIHVDIDPKLHPDQKNSPLLTAEQVVKAAEEVRKFLAANGAGRVAHNHSADFPEPDNSLAQIQRQLEEMKTSNDKTVRLYYALPDGAARGDSIVRKAQEEVENDHMCSNRITRELRKLVTEYTPKVSGAVKALEDASLQAHEAYGKSREIK
jgi:hypothetical protein